MRSGSLGSGLNFLLLLSCVCAFAVGLAGCSATDKQLNPAGGKTGGDAASSKKMVVQGSDTMAKMVRGWAGAFIKIYPEMTIDVQSADTGAGISNLIDGKINLAAASRELTAVEQELAHQKRVRLSRSMVAKDAVAIVVGPDNAIVALTMEELKGIFSGTLKRWSQIKSLPVAGQDRPIVVIGRETSSGTGDYLRAHILAGKPFGPHIKLMPSSDAVIAVIQKQNDAIGFVGMSQAQQAAQKVKVVQVKLNDASPAAEKGNSLSGNDYPLTRPLYLYYAPMRDSTQFDGSAKRFVDFCMSADGQKIAQDMGFMVIR